MFHFCRRHMPRTPFTLPSSNLRHCSFSKHYKMDHPNWSYALTSITFQGSIDKTTRYGFMIWMWEINYKVSLINCSAAAVFLYLFIDFNQS
jgi:hypothetical protein